MEKIHESSTEDKTLLHQETVESLKEEVQEVIDANETDRSPHLKDTTEVVEELTDVAIVVFTELYRRGVDIEEVLHQKMKFNENRE